MFMTPSDSSRRRIIMSKYIPGNQKHLTLNDRIYIENVLFITQRTFAFIVTIVKRPMPVEKSFSVALNVPHVLHVIRPARTLKKNDVNDWTKRHMFAMAARKR